MRMGGRGGRGGSCRTRRQLQEAEAAATAESAVWAAEAATCRCLRRVHTRSRGGPLHCLRPGGRAQVMREWSAEGEEERRDCFERLLGAVDSHLKAEAEQAAANGARPPAATLRVRGRAIAVSSRSASKGYGVAHHRNGAMRPLLSPSARERSSGWRRARTTWIRGQFFHHESSACFPALAAESYRCRCLGCCVGSPTSTQEHVLQISTSSMVVDAGAALLGFNLLRALTTSLVSFGIVAVASVPHPGRSLLSFLSGRADGLFGVAMSRWRQGDPVGSGDLMGMRLRC